MVQAQQMIEEESPVAVEAPSELSRLQKALDATRRALLAKQHNDGHWCGELEGDTILESEYILCLYFLGRGHEERVRKATRYVRQHQLPSGGWSIYPGGPTDVSASVKAYLVMKLDGDSPDAPHMIKARREILELGGIEATNSFTKLYLSMFGQYDWSDCPAIPPEMILLPKRFIFNIYSMSSWSRAIVMPLSIIWAHRPRVDIPERGHIAELRAPGAQAVHPAVKGWRGKLWGRFFVTINAVLKVLEICHIRPLRRRALARAETWILERLEMSDGLAAIFPPIVNTLIALRTLGYPMDHPVIQQQMKELERLEIEEGDTLRVQPCFSPVWDTALALDALLESGLPGDDPAVQRAARWLLDKEVRHVGDWRVANPNGPVGGWYFEYANELYPDCDDTAEVIKALAQVRFGDLAEEQRRQTAVERGVGWLSSMQNRDGGWAAFDKECDMEVLTFIPFADHNAMIDPSTADVTSRCLEALVLAGSSLTSSEITRAAAFLRSMQAADGTWYGRWGCNYLYGTWLALRGLRFAGVDLRDERFQRAISWLRACQNEDGGWGESPRSYDDPSLKGIGPSTAAQTAWALMGLMIANDHDSSSVRRGVDFLLGTQNPDGTWQDDVWTATGFPKVFYLRYHLYATYFPLQALSMYEKRSSALRRSGEPTPACHLVA